MLAEYIDANRSRWVDELQELVGIPSVSTDPAYAPEVRRAAEWVRAACEKRGLSARLVETERHPTVLAHSPAVPGAPHLMVYAHYDVQPAEDVHLWESPPFQPRVVEDRLYGRGASDNKGQLMAHLAAIESLVTVDGKLPLNLSVVVEGEEEIASPNLPKVLQDCRNELGVQLALVSDTSTVVKFLPTIHYSLRGIVGFEVFLKTAGRDVHSGVFGGSVPNAVHALTRLVAAAHDEHMHVTIPGFYDKVLEIEPWEKENLARIPFDEEPYRKFVGATELVGEAGFTTNERRWFRPTLECNGITGGYQGDGSKTIVPARASAKFTIRLVPDQEPAYVMDCAERWFREHCPSYAEMEFHRRELGPAYLLRRKGDLFARAARAVQGGFGQEPIFCRHGGAIPIVDQFRGILGVDTLLVGLGSPDDAIHSPNEKFELRNFYQGIHTLALLYRELATL